MKMIFRILGLYLLLCIYADTLTAQQPLRLQFVNMLGDSLVQLGASYKNAFNEPLTIRNFKYYISHIQVKDDEGNWYTIAEDYFLVNEADSSTKQINSNYNGKGITAIRFLLGVDSMHNISGVQTGALDPAKGMFWVWNSGYVMAKLEGKSAASRSPGNYFTYHIGGYKSNENAARWIELTLSSTKKSCHNIIIKADAGKWFIAAHDIKIAEHPVCHEPGNLAMQIADNYAQMFSIIEAN